jgi:hypothetical protein
MKKKPQRLMLEELEGRCLLATYGVPWANPGHLTISFAPDGTAVDGAPSALFQKFNPQGPTNVWETTILQALQTWAVNANINVGVVADGGQPFGSPGPLQGRPNSGDIRVAARPMGSDVLADSTPPDPSLGTLAGSVVFNSAAAVGLPGYGQYDLYSLALHEMGHALGFDCNLDPTSVMDQYYNGVRSGLSQGDVGMLQALYGGPRTFDPYAAAGNSSLATAATINVPEVAADITTAGENEFFKYTVPSNATSPVTITVQTAGLSLLTPRLTVFNAAGQVLGTSSSTDPLNNTVSVTLPNAPGGTTLYLQVQGARSDVFGIGGYRLRIDSGPVSEAQIASIDASLNGSTVTLATHNNGTLATAADLNQLVTQPSQGYGYAINSALVTAAQSDYYTLLAPTAGGSQTMVATVTPTGGSTLDPQITVYDAQGNQVTAQVLTSDGVSYAVQVVGVTAGARYYLRVSANAFANPANQMGTYLLGVNFQATAISLPSYASGTLTASAPVAVDTFQSNQSQVVELALFGAPTSPGGTVPTAVRMNIYNSQGTVVATLTALAGQLVTGDFYLAQGTYAVRFYAATQDGSALPDFSYTLQARVVSGPQDPPPIDPTYNPANPPPPPPPIVVSTTPPPTVPPLDPSSNPWAPPPPLYVQQPPRRSLFAPQLALV